MNKLFKKLIYKENICSKCGCYLDKDILFLDRLAHNKFVCEWTLKQLKNGDSWSDLKFPECVSLDNNLKISKKNIKELKECVKRINIEIQKLTNLYLQKIKKLEIPDEIFQENYKLKEKIKILESKKIKK